MKGIPNYLEKRKILHSKGTSPQELKEMGDLFLSHEQWNDAIDFYEKGGYTEGLEEILRISKDMGDFFMFRRIQEILKKNPSMEEWESLGDRAMELGRYQDARKAYEMSQNQVKLRLIQEVMGQKGGASDKLENEV
jgi:hypothetical protein